MPEERNPPEKLQDVKAPKLKDLHTTIVVIEVQQVAYPQPSSRLFLQPCTSIVDNPARHSSTFPSTDVASSTHLLEVFPAVSVEKHGWLRYDSTAVVDLLECVQSYIQCSPHLKDRFMPASTRASGISTAEPAFVRTYFEVVRVTRGAACLVALKIEGKYRERYVGGLRDRPLVRNHGATRQKCCEH